MRAFTSLAGHILGSHPQINGYYEMHLSYDAPQALDQQLEQYLENDELKADSRYLFDKLLHNDYTLQLDSLDLTEVKLLLSLREPEQSIKSIINLFAQKDNDELYASPLEAANYYIDRIKTLADFSQNTNHSYYYFDAEMLPGRPDTLLPTMTRWLDLDSPLSDSYTIFSQTGEDRKGDSSKHIHSGKINRAKNDYSTITVPDERLQLARQVYRDYRQLIVDGATDAVMINPATY